LAEQIRNGAPFDLFMAANTAFVEDLVKEQMIVPDSVELYAKGSLVLVVYRELGDRIKTLSDLKKPEVKKIALANPAFAPYGKAARQALEKAGLSKELEPKLVQAESVKQALVYAQRGDAEAALVGRSLADVPELHIVWVDRTLYDPIVQAMGISTRTSLSNEALAFSRFLMSEEGQDILGTFGFMPVETRVTLPAGGIAR
jgi:molybdate transport system substrate-binding protein